MIKNHQDFCAGLLYMVLGITAIAALGDNELGTLARMGPAYFPTIAAAGLIITGLIIAVKAVLVAPADGESTRIPFGKPMAAGLIFLSAAFYAATLLTLGFALSIGLMIVIASLAHPSFKWKDAVVSAIFLTALSAALFIGGLGLIVPIWPTFF